MYSIACMLETAFHLGVCMMRCIQYVNMVYVLYSTLSVIQCEPHYKMSCNDTTWHGRGSTYDYQGGWHTGQSWPENKKEVKEKESNTELA